MRAMSPEAVAAAITWRSSSRLACEACVVAGVPPASLTRPLEAALSTLTSGRSARWKPSSGIAQAVADAGRRADREALGGLLADRDVQRGHDQQREDRAERRGHAVAQAGRLDHGLQQRGDGGLAERAERQRGDRDAQLAGREVLVEVRRLASHEPRAGRARLRQPLRPHGDERELRGHEEPVDEHEQRDGDEIAGQHPRGAYLYGRSQASHTIGW